MNLAISALERKQLGRMFLPLAERCLITVQNLIDEGFENFRIQREFDKTICTPQEYALSQEIHIELGKEMISSSFSRVVESDVASDNYVSALLTRLRTERNEAGYDRSWLLNGDGERWMYEINPAKRQSVYMFLNQSRFLTELSVYRKAKETAQLNEQRHILFRHALVDMIESAPISSKFMVQFREKVDDEMSTLSFQPERRLSKLPNMLQYVMPLGRGIQLRFIVVMSTSMLEARLYLTEKNLGKKFDGNWGEWYSSQSAFEIRLWDIVPWFGNCICLHVPEAIVRFYAYLSVLKQGMPHILSATENVLNLAKR